MLKKMPLKILFLSVMVIAIASFYVNRTVHINNATNDSDNVNTTIPMTTEKTNTDYYVLSEFKERLDNSQRQRLCKLLSWSNLKRWDFNIFDVVNATNGESPLLFVGWAILGAPHSQHSMAQVCNSEGKEGQTTTNATTTTPNDSEGYNFFYSDDSSSSSEFHLNERSMKKLFNYLREIESDYNQENDYHNSIHAADVLQSIHAMIQDAAEGNDDISNTGFAPSKEDVFSVLVAAAVHDVGHPGLNNAFQINAQTDLAITYKNVSVLENHHASHALKKMEENNEKNVDSTDFNFLSDSSTQEVVSIRKKMVDFILMTDMSKHFKFVNDIEELIKYKDSVSSTTYSWTILCYMLHLADISNPAKAQQSSVMWTHRVMSEFFEQGDKEAKMGLPVSPLCDRNTTIIPDSQTGFIEYVVKPSFEMLALAIPTIGDLTLPNLEQNMNYWQNKATAMEVS